MDILATVLTVANTLTKLAPQFVATWADLKPFAQSLYEQFKGTPPTADELTALEAAIDALAVRLQEPLPPAQPGDPDYVKAAD